MILNMAQSTSGNSDTAPSAIGTLADAATQCANRLRDALDEVLPEPRRPVDLTRELGLDKTLASRVVKFAIAAEPVLCAIEGPGPAGLRQVSAALQQRGVDPANLVSLAKAINAYEIALAAFPSGRAGIQAALADRVHVDHEHLRRTARLSLFKSMTVLMGCQLDAAYHVYALTPSAHHPDRIDSVYIEQRAGFRRLRDGISRAIVCGVPATHGPDRGHTTNFTLNQQPLGTDPTTALVPEFCSPELPPMHVARRDTATLLAVDPGQPAQGAALTLATGLVFRGNIPRWATEQRPYDSLGVTMRKPVSALLFDLLIHRQLAIGTPIATLNVAGGPPTASPQADDFDAIDQPLEVMSMGAGVDRLGSKWVPMARRIAARAVETTGIDASEFFAYRVAIEYPIPGLTTRVWLRLPEKA